MKKLIALITVLLFLAVPPAFSQSTLEYWFLTDPIQKLIVSDFNQKTFERAGGLKILSVNPSRIKFVFKKFSGNEMYRYLECTDNCNVYAMEIDGRVFSSVKLAASGESVIFRHVIERLLITAESLGIKVDLNLASGAFGLNQEEAAVSAWLKNMRFSSQTISSPYGNVGIGK